MNHRIIYEDSRVREAWKLFIEKGMLKREVLRDQIAFSWARSRLSGLSENRDNLEFINEDINEGYLTLGDSFDEWTILNGYQFMLLNERFKVLHKLESSAEISSIRIDKGDILDEMVCGTLACHLSAQTGALELIVGYEHYLKCFHSYVDICIPIILNNLTYYVWLIKDISDFQSEELIQISTKVRETSLSIQSLQDNVELIPNYHNHKFVVLINSNGVILKQVNYGGINFECEKSIFHMTDLTFDKLKSQQCFLVEVRWQKTGDRENYFNKFICEVINQLEDCTMLLFKELSSSGEVINLLKGNIFNNIKYKKGYNTKDIAMIYSELKHNFEFVSQNSNPVFIYDDSGILRMEIVDLFINNNNSQNVRFYFIDCTQITGDELEDILFANKSVYKIGVFDWLGEGYLMIDNFSHLEKKVQSRIIRYYEKNKDNTLTNAIPRIIFGDTSEAKNNKQRLSHLISAYSHFNIIELRKGSIINSLVENKSEISIKECLGEQERTKEIEYFNKDETSLSEIISSFKNDKSENELMKLSKIKKPSESKKLIQDIEKELIEKVLYETKYHITETAKQLGIGRATLYRKIQQYNIQSRANNNLK